MSFFRNKLLKLELSTTVTTLAVSVGALISGIFGMNLHTGLEEQPGYFWIAVASIISVGTLITWISLRLYFRSKDQSLRDATRYKNNVFSSSINDDAYILSFRAEAAPSTN